MSRPYLNESEGWFLAFIIIITCLMVFIFQLGCPHVKREEAMDQYNDCIANTRNSPEKAKEICGNLLEDY